MYLGSWTVLQDGRPVHPCFRWTQNLSAQYDGRMTTEGFPDARDVALMKALKGALTESDYVVESMAAEVGISKESLGRYLRSEREMGTATFGRICEALGVTPAEMFARAERVLERTSVVTEPGVPTREPARPSSSEPRHPRAQRR